jgi:membrane protease YdiL (CAAX protease family)
VQGRERFTDLGIALGAVLAAWMLLQSVGPGLRALGGATWGPALVGLSAVGVPAVAGTWAAVQRGTDSGWARPAWGALLAGLVVGVGLPGVGGFVLIVLDPTGPEAGGPTGSLLPLLCAWAIVPALCEEALLRGVVMGAVRRAASPGLAVAVAALASGALHAGWASQAAAVAQGAVLGLIAVRARSLWPAVLAHAAGNTGVLLIVRTGADLPVPLLATGATVAVIAALVAPRPAGPGEEAFSAR